MYQHLYQYLYRFPYDYSLSGFRTFKGLVGKFFTIPIILILPNGQELPEETWVFIHKVRILPDGQEMVTIVYPLTIGGNCMTGAAEVSALQLDPGPGVPIR